MATLLNTTIDSAIGTAEIRNSADFPVIDVNRIGNDDRFLRQYVIQHDLVDRTFTTAFALGPTFSVIPGFKAGSLLHIYYFVPMRNDSTVWGGAYIEPQIRYNEGAWISLGSCGHEGGVMASGAQRIVAYRNHMLIDPQQSADFSVQMQFYCRSYDGTASWNASRDIGLISETAPLLDNNIDDFHHMHVKIKEIALLKAPI